ncbi:transmembrane protein 242-like [Ornithodoros turicata]
MEGSTPESTDSKAKQPGKDGSAKKFAEGAFLVGLAGAATLFGFGATIAMAKKRDPKFFTQGILGSRAVPESGTSLALRALGWGTLYSTAGFGIFSFLVWKMIGAHSFEDFRHKVGSFLPRIPKKEPQGKSDFTSFRELMNYIVDDSAKKE